MRSENQRFFLAIDIGASSGRHIVGIEERGALSTEEVYRFPNGMKERDGRLVWEIDTLFEEILEGIRLAFLRYPAIESLAIDTWGVDYVLLEGEREILPCYAYRDGRTARAIPLVHGKLPFTALYRKTGIQFQPFNTIYQFCDDFLEGRLSRASDFLMLPEYFSYRLTGKKAHEYTNATTTGLLNGEGEYDRELITALGFPPELFRKPVLPGTALGPLLPAIERRVGGNCTVMLCASHDTASAVEGIPMEGNEPYLSSGTWSLLGVKVPAIRSDERSMRENWSNEGGVGYYRYQKNIMGQWVVNRLREELCPDKPFSVIAEEARTSDYGEIADVNDARFFAPKCMKEAFLSALNEPPRTEKDFFACAYRSLAKSYAAAVSEMEENLSRTFRKLYLVGGGAKNGFLNELTAQACGLEVVALPIEATALGNLKLQTERKL